MRALVSSLALLVCAGLAPANVTVTGNGKVVYIPDIGYITVGVSSDGKTAAEAWEKNREIVRRVFEALRRRGIDPKDMQTNGLNVSPKYIHRPGAEPELVG
ncbi:MAG TPA: SIMPL domain-containing protein, partial [Gemmataceae bacterium]|nr:SIMPL domain-containing protein [Gemmataceae bacterium]